MTTVYGHLLADYSFARPDLNQLKQAGYVGAIRYLDWQPNAKVIQGPEAKAILDTGLTLTLVWESVDQRALDGYSAGVDDATEAWRQVAALGAYLGMDASSWAVYFVAEDPSRVDASLWPSVASYFDGILSVSTLDRVGAYGSQDLVRYLITKDKASLGWQVGGWSESVDTSCSLYQRLSPTIAPLSIAGDIDEDVALTQYYGQIGGSVIPTPPEAKIPPHMNIVPSGKVVVDILIHGPTVAYLWDDGSIWQTGLPVPVGSPICPFGQPYWGTRKAAALLPFGTSGYTVVDTEGETYSYGS